MVPVRIFSCWPSLRSCCRAWFLAIVIALPSISLAAGNFQAKFTDVFYPTLIEACQANAAYGSAASNPSSPTVITATGASLVETGSESKTYLCNAQFHYPTTPEQDRDGTYGYVWETLSTCPVAGTQQGGGLYQVSSAAAMASGYCTGGCSVEFDGSYWQGSDGKTYAQGTMSYTGGSCTSGNAPPSTAGQPADPQKPCDTGNTVEINGVVHCMDAGTPGDNPGGDSGGGDGTGDGTGGTGDGGDGGTGDGGDGTGGDGSGGTGGGTDDGSDDGTDEPTDDDGECDPKEQICNDPGTDGLYTKKTKTIADVLNRFTSTVQGSGLGQAITGFFSVTIPSGTCPNWRTHVSYLDTDIDLTQVFCSGEAVSLLQTIGAVLLVVAGFGAFRWAVL